MCDHFSTLRFLGNCIINTKTDLGSLFSQLRRVLNQCLHKPRMLGRPLLWLLLLLINVVGLVAVEVLPCLQKLRTAILLLVVISMDDLWHGDRISRDKCWVLWPNRLARSVREYERAKQNPAAVGTVLGKTKRGTALVEQTGSGMFCIRIQIN